MAKMFYTLEEAAEKLGIDQQTLKDMAARNEVQQFRDGDKLMFKRDQIDAQASSGGDASNGPIDLADSGFDFDDAIDLKDDTAAPAPAENANDATGISVFDAGEIDLADPMAQTQVSGSLIDDEDLALESVGSGSGLLDLTHESDDTSLGADLLDGIHSGSETSFGTGMAMDSSVGASGIFDGGIALDNDASAAAASAGIDSFSPATDTSPPATRMAQANTAAQQEPNDPAGSGFGSGMLFGAILALVLSIAAIIPALAGVDSQVIQSLYPKAESGQAFEPNTLYAVAGGLLVLSFACGFIGMFIGKSATRR